MGTWRKSPSTPSRGLTWLYDTSTDIRIQDLSYSTHESELAVTTPYFGIHVNHEP